MARRVSCLQPMGRTVVGASPPSLPAGPGAARSFNLKVEQLSIDELQLLTGSRSLGVEDGHAARAYARYRAEARQRPERGGRRLQAGARVPAARRSGPRSRPSSIPSTAGSTGTPRIGPSRSTACAMSRAARISRWPAKSSRQSARAIRGNSGSRRASRASSRPTGRVRKRSRSRTAAVDGRIDLARKTFFLDRFAVGADPGGVSFAGTVDWIDGPRIRLGARLVPTPVETVERGWPAFVASPVRAWLINRFETGTVTGGTLQIDYDKVALARMRADRAPPDSAVQLDFAVSKGKLRFLDGVPELDDIEGHGHITGRTTHFWLDSGAIDASGRKITVLGWIVRRAERQRASDAGEPHRASRRQRRGRGRHPEPRRIETLRLDPASILRRYMARSTGGSVIR